MAPKTATATAYSIPSERDATLAGRAGRALETLTDGTQPVSARFGDRTVDLPAPAVRLLREVLARMADGKGVALTPLHAELTTRQAAELLQVSRTHLVQLLDEGRIPCRKVGSHRRVRAEDILAWRRETEVRRREALDEMTARDQELDLQQAMARLTALLDANVLYPAGLRDLLLRLADCCLYVPLWSADIHAEWMRSLLADRPDIEASVLKRTRAIMDGHFPDAVVTGYETLTATLDLPDSDDCHVPAAAIRGGADAIVTRNLPDFPADRLTPHKVAAHRPDAFIARLFEADPKTALEAVRGHRAALRHPPRSAGDYLAAPERLGLTGTVSLLRAHETAI